MNVFFMVIDVEANGPTTQRHTTLQSAMDEAERLCKKMRKQFAILQTVGTVDLPMAPLVWEIPTGTPKVASVYVPSSKPQDCYDSEKLEPVRTYFSMYNKPRQG